MNQTLYNWLKAWLWDKRKLQKKYWKYFDTWIFNLTEGQIDNFKIMMENEIKSKNRKTSN
jgi:hypothetical protein